MIDVVLLLASSLILIPTVVYSYSHDLLVWGIKGKIRRNQINTYLQSLKSRRNDLQPLLEFELNDQDIDSDIHYSYLNGTNSHLKHGNKTDFIVKTCFCSTVVLSFQLVMLILLELVCEASTIRQWLFQLVIDCLIVLLSLAVPISAFNLLIFKKLWPDKSNYHRLVVIILFIAWLFLLHLFGDLSQSFTPELVLSSSRSLIERKINELSIAGITIMAILSGLGCSSTSYEEISKTMKYRTIFKSKKSTTKMISINSLNSFIQSYNNTNSLINKRKNQLNNCQVQNSGKSYNTKPTSRFEGIFHKVQSFANLYQMTSEEKELENEIEALYKLRNSIYDDFWRAFEIYNTQHSFMNNDSDIITMFTKWSQIGFAIYCIYRIISVLLIKFPLLYLAKKETNANDNDALAITIAKIIISVFGVSYTETQLVHQICFLLSGGLFVCSISSLMTTLNSFRKILPSKIPPHIYGWLKYLSIAELFGVYVLSTALLIRTNLPESISNQISQILSLTGSSQRHSAQKEVEFIDDWFDKVFGFTTILSLLQLILRSKFDDTDRYLDDQYDEEMIIETTKSL